MYMFECCEDFECDGELFLECFLGFLNIVEILLVRCCVFFYLWFFLLDCFLIYFFFNFLIWLLFVFVFEILFEWGCI